MINRRTFLGASVGMGLGASTGLIGRSLLGTPIASAITAEPLTLTADEVRFLRSNLMDQTENEGRRLMRIHEARITQLQLLGLAAGISIWEDSSSTEPVRWPWKSRDEFHQRLWEAHEHQRRTCPASRTSSVGNLRYIGFRSNEVSFLLCWFQEYNDWCMSHEELDKGLRYHPTLRLVRESLPSLGIGYTPMLDFSLALCDELGLDCNRDGPALPLKNVRPSLPWKTIEELNARRRDLAAYKVRKDKAENVSGTWWQRVPLDFSQRELRFLEAWLQERLHGTPGPAHGEQTSRGVWNAQLMNLVWASNLEIEPREATKAAWPWRSREEFYGRLRMAGARLYKQAWFPPKPTVPFSPEESRFVIAWIQESEGRGSVFYDEPRPVLDVVMAHVPELIKECPRTKWCEHHGIAHAWLKTNGLHRLAVAGGPPPEGPIVYPWKDRTEFEARVRNVERTKRLT